MTPDLLSNDPTDRVRLLRLNREEKRNALSTPMLEALATALSEADREERVRVVVITGGDKLFAAGADLDELAASSSSDELRNSRFRAWAAIQTFSKPLIAAVEGWCLGAGLELVMRTDLVVAAKGARFGQPETNLGIMPGAGGTSMLPRIVGRSLAIEMVLLGEPISADRAYSAGLATKLAEDGKALIVALELARKLAGRAPHALCTAKASISRFSELPLRDHLLAERRSFVSLLSGEEKTRGLAAFREKRAAEY